LPCFSTFGHGSGVTFSAGGCALPVWANATHGPDDVTASSSATNKRASFFPLIPLAPYGLRMTRVAAVPLPLPCHSANSKALLTSESGKLCETTFDSGYLSLVRTRKSRAAGMIHGL